MDCIGVKGSCRQNGWRRAFRHIWLTGLVAVVTAAGMLTGCAGKEEPGPPDAAAVSSLFAGSFSALADVAIALPGENEDEQEEILSLQAQITRSEDCCLVEVMSPEHLEGLSFTVDSIDTGNLTVSYKGISIQPDAMPAANLGSMVAGTLKALSQPEGITITESAEGWCATGQTDAGSYALLLGKNDYMPVGLTVPDAGLSLTFSSFEAMSVFRPDRIEEDFASEESSSESSSEESSAPSSESSQTRISSQPVSSSETESSSSAGADTGEQLSFTGQPPEPDKSFI